EGSSRVDYPFGNLAIPEGPMALRPTLADGLPLSRNPWLCTGPRAPELPGRENTGLTWEGLLRMKVTWDTMSSLSSERKKPLSRKRLSGPSHSLTHFFSLVYTPSTCLRASSLTLVPLRSLMVSSLPLTSYWKLNRWPFSGPP